MYFNPLHLLAAAFGMLLFWIELHERCGAQKRRAICAPPCLVIMFLTVLSSVLVWDLWVQQNTTLKEVNSANAILAIVAGLSGPHFLNGYLVTQAQRMADAKDGNGVVQKDFGLVFIMDRLWKWLSDTLAGSSSRRP